MMLHVFHVDVGVMKTFDMKMVSESVANLKEAVEKTMGIPVEQQVLLISGGEYLDPNNKICSYVAGTDTNPIFLFSKSVIENTYPQPGASSGEPEVQDDLAERIKEAIDMPATFTTVQRRAQLAQLLYDRAKEQIKACERLVHDQHMQQQGWAAVVANLEDIVTEFTKRGNIFKEFYNEYLAIRDTYLSFLTEYARLSVNRFELKTNFKHSFRDDLETLRKIPMCPILVQNETKEEETSLETSKEEGEISTVENAEWSSLFDWISHTDGSIEQLFEHCERGLEQFNELTFNKTLKELEDTLESAKNPNMKQVKGLSDRLSGLENLMREAKKLLGEQHENAKSFQMNQSRVSNLKDASILPDLCASHRKQLVQMAHAHQYLLDIRRRCAKAKEELSSNLYQRLKWVMFVEDTLMRQDNALLVHHDCLRNLRCHLEVLQQIHLTPALYLNAVAEVVRRRKFSQSFLLWASDIACQLLSIHNSEVARRKEFQSQFEGHFLNTLFPGMDDLPPSFATEAPSPFDQKLPCITQEDVDRLREQLPEYAEYLAMPDTSAFSNFFLIKSLVRTELDKVDESQDIKDVEQKLVKVVQDAGLASNLDNNLLRGTGSEPSLVTAHGLPHLKDLDRGCESETDTEEFEKVGQSPLEPSPRPGMQDAATCTEDNLQISRSEHERLKGTLEHLGQLSTQALSQLHGELKDMRSMFMADLGILESGYKSLTTSFNSLVQETAKAEKAATETLASAHEAELSSFKQMYSEKEEELGNVKIANIMLGQKFQRANDELTEIKTVLTKLKEEHSAKIEQLQKEILDKDAEKEKTIKETVDRLNREHKAEIENIRSRFKLMTMERSPSESSLEKVGDFSSIPNHESILLQMTETFELNKDVAIKEAVDKENERWQKVLDERLTEMEKRFTEEKQMLVEDVAKKIHEEKEKQIDVLRERERNLNLEIIKYKSTIQQLTEAEVVTSSLDLKKQVDLMKKENDALKQELESLRRVPVDMAASVAVLPTVPENAVPTADTMTISNVESMCESSASGTGKKSKSYVDRCPKGLKVDIVWDETHHNFRCDLDGKLYFVHCDCLPVMNLEVVNGVPNKERTVAEVIEKEYCMSKKDDNRYNVPKGRKFFRVKVKPIDEVNPESTAPPTLPPVEQPEEIKPESVEKSFYHDSGVVEGGVEEAAMAIENLLSDNENDDRYSMKLTKERQNWLGLMVSRLFGNSSK